MIFIITGFLLMDTANYMRLLHTWHPLQLSIRTMGDPVAEKSGFLCTYMSNHPDILVAYAKWFGKITDNISSAEMSAIDTKVCDI